MKSSSMKTETWSRLPPTLAPNADIHFRCAHKEKFCEMFLLDRRYQRISSRQCKQRFFRVSSNHYLKWWYTFYDWNSVDIISPDIYQKKTEKYILVGVKGISPFSFLALHQWKFSLVWLLRFDRVYSMLSDSPSRSRGVPSLYHRETKRRHPRKR